ncbi:MAG TPA: sugar transferase [Amaricoccus sp.]|nr:sugar transferase [Amaricoccus sp.]
MSGTSRAARPGAIGSKPIDLAPPAAAARAILKRGLDLTLATLGLPVATPLMLLIALAIRLAHGGPAIYRHRRVGRGGVAFDCLKFRTMGRDADRALALLLACSPAARAEWEATRKLRNDPRVLGRLGRFLRRTSLDELPQLWNVLRGEMSLVGPRPVVDEELAHYAGQRRWYLAVRPGLTGPWQVGGRSDTSYAARVRLDVDYARNPSLRRDLRILLATLRVFATGRGAC